MTEFQIITHNVIASKYGCLMILYAIWEISLILEFLINRIQNIYCIKILRLYKPYLLPY